MSEHNVVGLDDLVARRREARDRGLTVVFTNGCFDILHMGHVRYLHQARELGDLLFVGVNSDESASKLKGPGRPVNTAADRAGVLAALRDVSAVTIFDQPTAEELVRRLAPDIYVKGGDYEIDPSSASYPPEAGVAVSHGAIFKVIPFEEGYSTTSLLQRMEVHSQ